MKITDGIKVGFGVFIGVENGKMVPSVVVNSFISYVADENNEADMEYVNKHCHRAYERIKEFKEKIHTN